MDFEQDSYVQIAMPNGAYRYGYVMETAEEGQHLTICMHEEGTSKLAFDTAIGVWNTQALPRDQYGLTDQEFRVLSLFIAKYNTKTIGVELGLAPATVRAYIRVLRHKLQVQDRVQLTIVGEAVVKSTRDLRRQESGEDVR